LILVAAVESVPAVRMLRDLMADEREVWGLLALLLVTDARRRRSRTGGRWS
jgi:RNA polymerase sigma-70 factor (ECF subfamily)